MTAMMASVLLGLCSLEVSGQTYSGYLKADGAASDQIDSIYVTMTIPEVGQRNRVMESGAGKSYTLKAIDDDRYSGKGYYASPWMAGVKTNLLSDLISIPYLGVEVQLADKLSLDVSGWISKWNVFYPNKQTMLYGAAPEIRWWFGNEMMKKGHFVGLHGMAAWYTLEWKDRSGKPFLYQNGTDDLNDAGSTSPAWSCGLTYGYALPLDKNGRLGLEFYAGFGYYNYQQKCIPVGEDKSDYRHEVKDGIGITKVGVSLAYRFSLRRYKER